jgi:hypothetical protein
VILRASPNPWHAVCSLTTGRFSRLNDIVIIADRLLAPVPAGAGHGAMMKCNICGGRTLPGAKLCLPCRAALRRARDDTVSELLPLPRRLEAIAFAGARTVSRTLDIVGVRRSRRHPRPTSPAAPPATQGRSSSLQTAAIALFALAIGFLAYGFMQQLRGETDGSVVHQSPEPMTTSQPSAVSPAALAAEARRNTALAPLPTEPSTEQAPAPETPRAEPIKPRRNAPSGRPAAKVESAAVASAEVVPTIVAAVPKTAPEDVAPAVVPDRWQSLSAALGRCMTGNLFSRVACEHSARAQFCDGYWGQVTQCPGGVVNDHGQ